MEANIINLYGFTLWDIISKWGENYVKDHPDRTFEELEQAFCKRFQTMKNDNLKFICNWETYNNKSMNIN
jgi:hypothetical protein